MRILIFIGSLTGGGAERVTVALSRFLIARGHSVGVITTQSDERDFYQLPDGVARVALGLAGESRGIRKLFANFHRLSALRAVLAKERADMVIGMMTTSAVLCIFSAFGLPTRVVASERNYPGRRPCALPWAILRRLFYRYADVHVAQTQEAANWLVKNTAARNVHIIPNSVDWPLAHHAPAVSPSVVLNEDARLVLAVGTKPHQKGFDLLLKAFSGVASIHPEWRLALVGVSSTSHEGVALVEQASRLGLQNKLLLPGRIGNVVDWYVRADLFVLSSRYEGFPNVLLEAMAAGCPCLSFDCDTGPRDIIDPGKNGELVPAEDTAALERAMLRLIETPEDRTRFAAAAVEVRERFSEEKVLGAWCTVLEKYEK